MPYSGPGDDSLPDNVKEMSADDRAQWVEVFNSAFATCEEENGDDCEASAFAQANGVIAKKNRFFTGLWGLLRSLFLPQYEHAASRALNIHDDMIDQIFAELDRLESMGWLHGIYVENERLFAVISEAGQLFRYPITVMDDKVTLGQPEPIALTFTPRTRVMRQKDGTARWLSVSCTAILNRVGEIDSTALFDDMIKRASESGEWPERQIYHLGSKFRTGQVDSMWRDGVALITTGVWDDSDLARAEIAALEREPEYWGESIRYDPLDGEMVRVSDVDIPVYTAGVMIETSLVPQHRAAAWYTKIETKEVGRMRADILDVLKKLFDGDEEKVESFASLVDDVNARATDPAVVSRATDPDPEPEPEPEGDLEPVPAVVPNAEPFVLDDAAIDQIVARMAEHEALAAPIQQLTENVRGIVDALEPIPARFDTLEAKTRDIDSAVDVLSKHFSELADRLAVVERADETKLAERVADLSRRQRNGHTVTYRPRDHAQRDPNVGEDGKPRNLAAVAANTLEKLG